MTRLSHVAAAALVLTTFGFALAACGPSPTPAVAAAAAAATSAAPSCDERSRGAMADVLAVVATSRACAVDADCVIVSVGASCFDVCSRGVSASGATAVREAEERINRTTCANYKQDGCSFSVPPCMPPGKATCNAGLCE